jgi:hypothetical protein
MKIDFEEMEAQLESFQVDVNKLELTVDQYVVALYRQYKIGENVEEAIKGFNITKVEIIKSISHFDTTLLFLRKKLMNCNTQASSPCCNILFNSIQAINSQLKTLRDDLGG